MQSKILRKVSLACITAALFVTTPIWGAEPTKGVMKETTVGYDNASDAQTKVAYITEGESVTIQKHENGYYEVALEDGTVAYVAEDQVEVEEPKEEVKEEKVEVQAPKISAGQEVVNYAKQFIGTRYVYGGNSLVSGVDCSGFTSQVYKKFGVNLQRSSRSQYASNGVKVTKDQLQPGDLVFYGYSSVNHVAIYIGDGKIVHASTSDKGVRIDPMMQRGMAPIIGYKRVI